MNPTVFTSAGLALLLANLTQAAAGVAGHLLAATVSLFTSDINPGKAAVLGDFTLATFAGSTPLPVGTWGEVFQNADQDPEMVATVLQWNWTAAPAESVFGIVLRSAGAGTPLLGYARLLTPKPMETVNDSLAIVPRFIMSATGFGAFSTLTN